MFHNNNKNKVGTVVSVFVLGLFLTSVGHAKDAVVTKAMAKSTTTDNLWKAGEKMTTVKRRSFRKKLYGGAGIILSNLKPRVLTKKGKVTKKTNAGFKAYAGYNINQIFAVEAAYYDLGAATVNTGTVKGDIDYKVLTLQAVAKKKLTKRTKVMGKLGIASLENSASKNLKYRQVNKNSVVLGVGGEYLINQRMSVRAEYEAFDKDYQALSLGLNVKFR